MKILSIRIKNLASLAGEHEINFESEPLANAGLIAITGKTGAGKSTLLDAMCLALFNRVPRLKNSDGKLLDVDGSELLTNSPQTVLRRGTGHGFAEVSFVAPDQKVYLARWEIKRARENPKNKLQGVQRVLKCLTDGTVVADKRNSVEESIKKITQLTFEQFTRAVLLAQSDVTAFLKARDNERGELLEYLTNSSIFAKVGQLAFEKTKHIANQRKQIENVVEHIQFLSDDDLADLNIQLEAINQQHQKLEEEKSQLQKQQQWFEHKNKLETDIQQRQQKIQIQKQSVEALAPKKLKLNQLERFAFIRSHVIQHKNLFIKFENLQPKLEKAQQTFHTIEQQYHAEKSVFDQVSAEYHQQQQFENKNRDQIQLVRDCIAERRSLSQQFRKAEEDLQESKKQLIPHLTNKTKIKEQLKQIQNEIGHHIILLQKSKYFSELDNACINQIQLIIQNYVDFEIDDSNVEQADVEFSVKQKQLEELIAKFTQDDVFNQKVTDLRFECDQIACKLNLFNSIQSQWQNLQQSNANYHELTSSNNTLNTQMVQTKTELERAELHYQEQKDAHEELEKILAQQRILNTENIERLRAKLSAGEPCLVCGSTHHPYTEKEAFSDALIKLQEQQVNQAVESEKLAFGAWQKLQITFAEQKATLDANSKQIVVLTKQRQKLQSELEEQLTKFDIHFDFSKNELTQIIKIQQEQAQDIQDQLKFYEQIKSDRYELARSILQTTQQFQNCIQQIQFYKKSIFSVQQHIDYLTFEGKQNSQIAIQTIFEMTQEKVEKPHEWLENFEKNRIVIQEKFTNARQRFDQIEQNFKDKKNLLDELHHQNTPLLNQIEEENKLIQQWLKQNTDFSEFILNELSTISHDQVQQLKQDILQVERDYLDIEASINTVQSQLTEHLKAQPVLHFDDLISKITLLKQHIETLIEQRDALKLKLEIHQQNVAKKKQYVEQIQKIQAEESRWSKISNLMGDSTGKKFRDYAQQYHLDILVEYANQQLAMLSQRYTLKRLDHSLSLAIVDHDMDGETRSVSSLSGGESFLTALALSLAIANMASGSMKLESLFIDEGFGTLDPTSLHMVMNALDHLQSQGRKVVLISHIQEMHERIPVQIQVQPLGAGASTIQIVG